MAIGNPRIAASSIERSKTRVAVVPTAYDPPVTNPIFVSSSTTLVYTQKTTTNLIPASENFEPFQIWYCPVAYNIQFFTYSGNSVSSPIGTLTADRLTAHPAYGPVYLRYYMKLEEVAEFTFSIYLKVPSATATINLGLNTADLFAPITNLALTTATVTTEWQRFSVTGVPPGPEGIMLQIGGYGGWAIGQTFDLWGAQLEKSSTMGPYVSTGNASFGETASYSASQTSNTYEEVSTAPSREGQIVFYKNGDTGKLYVAIDIDGTITWKPCIAISEYIDPRTGEAPDPNLALFSPLAS